MYTISSPLIRMYDETMNLFELVKCMLLACVHTNMQYILYEQLSCFTNKVDSNLCLQ